MKKMRQRIVSVVMIFAMLLTLSGCGFSVGSTSGDEDYKSLFPDRAATLDKNYKTKDVGYKFSYGEGNGELMVYVDTSEGHSFEMLEDVAGFKIKDKDGNDALYAVCLERDMYAEYSAYCDSVKTVNGRDFLYSINADNSEDCYSYMADCGLDVGIVLEVHDNNTENFGLVAFRGTPLEGASSDVYEYKGVLEDDYDFDEFDDIDVYDEFSDDDWYSDDSDLDAEAAEPTFELPEQTKTALSSLQSDYSLVNWGVEYTASEDYPGCVISVTPGFLYDGLCLVVGVTNLYDKEISFMGTAQAMDDGGNAIGEGFVYNSCIGSGNTIIEVIDCGNNVPDGRIHWTNVQISEPYGEYVPWEADYSITGKPSDGYLTVNYELYASDKSACVGDTVRVLLLDEDGFVMGSGMGFGEDIAAGEKVSGSIDVIGEEDLLKNTKSLAMFTNPRTE